MIYLFISYSFTISLINYGHKYLWTKIHRVIHGLEINRIMNIKYYKKVKMLNELYHLYSKEISEESFDFLIINLEQKYVI